MKFTPIALFLTSMATSPLTFANQIEWTLSTENSPWQKQSTEDIDVGTDSTAPHILLHTDTQFQAMEGFGGSFNELGWVALNKASEEDAKAAISALFGDEGAAFTLARIPIGASDFALDGYSLAAVPEDYSLEHFSIQRDRENLLPFIKAAMRVRPDLQAWASPWSPPAWMKTNNSYSKGSLRNEPKVLQAYADYFALWIQAYRQEGVNLYAISPQNEPNILNVYPTTLWSSALLSTFIGDYLGPTLAQEGIDIELWLGLNGDPFNGGENPNDRLISVMTDKQARKFIDGIGFQYDSRNQIALANQLFPDTKLMQSESMCFNGDNSWAQAQELFKLMQRYIDGGANAYFAWNMILNETGKSSWDWAQNALITVDQHTGQVTYNGEFYVYKHFSHYVKPGAKRVLTTGNWSDQIAFENEDGSYVILVTNTSDGAHEAKIGFDSPNIEGFKVTVPAHSFSTFVVTSEQE